MWVTFFTDNPLTEIRVTYPDRQPLINADLHLND